jgi:hypothetical protein
MAEPVELSVKSQLLKIIGELEKITNTSRDTTEALKQQGKETAKVFDEAGKKTEEQIKKGSGVMRRMLDSLKGDLKTLASMEALKSGLSLAHQFEGSIQEAVKLSDTIRRLGGTFGIASKDFSGFQTKMQKGLGDIGLSSEAAAKALEGLAETPVRGQENLLAYAKSAGQLASIGGQRGQEDKVAKGLSGIIESRGGNSNDIGEMQKVTEDLRRAVIATGKSPTEMIEAMEQIFTKMPEDLQKAFSTRSLATLAAGATQGGPNATKFIQDFLGKSQWQRAFQQVTGATKLFGPKGFDTEAIKKFYAEAKNLGSGDVRIGLKALGVDSDEAADGFVRLASHLEEVAKAQEKVEKMTGDVNSSYKETIGLSDSFKGAINKVKGIFSPIVSAGTHGVTKATQDASSNTVGAIGTVLAGGALAAILSGKGLKGVGNAVLGVGKRKALEEVTGEKVEKVEVMNFDELEESGFGGKTTGEKISESLKGAGGIKGLAGKAAGAVGGLAAAGSVGYAVGNVIEGQIDEHFGTERDAAIDRLVDWLDSKGLNPSSQKVVVEVNSPTLKATKSPTRGAQQ